MKAVDPYIPPNSIKTSDELSDLAPAISIYINDLVYELKRENLDVISLSLGEAFFDIPLLDFGALDFAKGYHYSDSQGLPALREKIQRYYEREYAAPFNAEKELLISAGSKIIIFMALRAICNAGDNIIVHEPAWVSYAEQAKLIGVETRYIPFDAGVEDFEQFFCEKTKVCILNNPNNPAGSVYTAEQLMMLKQACDNNGVLLLVDEAYSDFVDNNTFTSVVRLFPDLRNVIAVNSLSKNFGVSGWRIGYCIAEHKLIKLIQHINQHLITCAPTILLNYCEHYFEELLSITLPQVKAIVKKREEVRSLLEKLQLKTLDGQSTFYFFLDIENYNGSSKDFALSLLVEKGVAVVPGSAYGKSTDRFVRISFGTESMERIWDALSLIRSHIDNHQFDQHRLDSLFRKLGLPAPSF